MTELPLAPLLHHASPVPACHHRRSCSQSLSEPLELTSVLYPVFKLTDGGCVRSQSGVMVMFTGGLLLSPVEHPVARGVNTSIPPVISQLIGPLAARLTAVWSNL